MDAQAGGSSPGPGVVVILPPALLRLFPGAPRRLVLEAGSVDEAVTALDERWPGMGDRIRDSRPAIRRHMKVFVDGEPAELATHLAPGAEIFVVTAVSGG